MKKTITLALALIALNSSAALAQSPMEARQTGLPGLEWATYQMELSRSPLAIVAIHQKNNVPDHNGQLMENLVEVTEFYANYPMLKFYQVESYSNPILVKQLGVQKFPTIAIYRFGKLDKMVEDVFMSQDLFPLVQDSINGEN